MLLAMPVAVLILIVGRLVMTMMRGHDRLDLPDRRPSRLGSWQRQAHCQHSKEQAA